MGAMTVDGIPVEFEACDHCGAVPTESDARRFIKGRESICDACREPIRVTGLRMCMHRKGKHGEAWDGVWTKEDYVILEPRNEASLTQRTQKWVHATCYKKMFPDGEGLREQKS